MAIITILEQPNGSSYIANEIVGSQFVLTQQEVVRGVKISARYDTSSGTKVVTATIYHSSTAGSQTSPLATSTQDIYTGAAQDYTFPFNVTLPAGDYAVIFTNASNIPIANLASGVTNFAQWNNWYGPLALDYTYALRIAILADEAASLPSNVSGTSTLGDADDGSSDGKITLTQNMTVEATGDLTLNVPKVADLAGGKTIEVKPGGKLKVGGGRKITISEGTKYKLPT